ncbi:MAG TPA: ATP-binding cassette domain-containing protein, partial [Candidatus Ozemobacteraceae bacterium]|nr:ATP-binding cassette domain-containing protein [Candidatus Ozemobacteraceae bacterium]
ARLSGQSGAPADLEEHLKRVEMWEFRDRLVMDCSKGMRQRTDIARLLLRQARLIFLDEPFSGLDPCGQVMLKELLLSLKQQGIGILVNSHAAGILADVCDRVCIMHRGRLLLSDRLESLLRTDRIRVRASFAEPSTAAAFLAGNTGIHAGSVPSTIEATVSGQSQVTELVRRLQNSGGTLQEVTPLSLSLDQLFVQVIGSRNPDAKGGIH